LNGIAQLQSIAAASPEFLPARMALGVAQLSQGNLMQAQAELAQVVQRAPDNLEARKLLARVRLQLDQPEEALRVLTPALDANAADPQLYALLAAASSRLGESDSTVEALEHGVRVHPSDRTLKLSLARAYLVSGRAKQALELLAPGAAGAPDPPRDALFVAAVDAVRGPRAAQDQVEEFLAARPKDPATLNLAAAFFTTQWQYGRAHALLDAALAANGHDVLTLTNLARVDLATGNAAGAENALRTALTYDEHNVALRIALAHLAMRRGEFAQAEQLLQAGGGAAASPQLQFAIAQLRLARGDLAQASAELDGALASQPRRPDLVNEAGIVLMAGREYAAALARFRRATELAPDEARYWLNSGRAQLALDEPTAARESFEGALKLKPGWTPAVAALCLIDVREKRYDAALARVGQLLARRPNDPDALVLQGDVQAAAGRLELAAAAYTDAQRRRPSASVAVKLYQIRRAAKLPAPEGPLQQWLAAQPNDYRVRSVLGNFYLEQKLLPQCAREFETVVQQVPADVLALNNLAWTYEQLHDPRAEPIAERAYQLAPASAAVADTLGWILASR
ncbi:MAG: tetratricopeptide repeat protein, partial [Steroidobacteraceae bacterium]